MGYIKDKVYVPSLTTNLKEFKIRIKDAINAVIPDMISNVWEEFDYCKMCVGQPVGVISNICNQSK
jgi:hypothetical protein